MSDQERRNRLHEMLMEEKRRLWNELRLELFEKQEAGPRGQRDLPHDLGDQSMLDVLEDTGLAVADIHREQLTRLEMAIVRVEQGSYGLCEECGKKIDEARLRVAPFATSCVNCQEQLEKSALRQRGPTL